MTDTTAPATVYQTLLTLDGNHRDVRNAVLDTHHMHNLVMSGYRNLVPDGWDQVRQALNVLFAVRPNRDNTLSLIAQSTQAPDWTDIPDDALTTAPNTWSIPTATTAGQRLWFDLRANPTRRTPAKPPARGRNVAITGRGNQLDWLHRQGERHGFKLVVADAVPGLTLRSEAKSLPVEQRQHAKAVFTVKMTHFTGVLEVTDPDQFTVARVKGIGRAKAYGCGLLLTRSTE